MIDLKELRKNIDTFNSLCVALNQPEEIVREIRRKNINIFIHGEDEYGRALCEVNGNRVILSNNPIKHLSQSGKDLLNLGARVAFPEHPLYSIQNVLVYGHISTQKVDRHVRLSDGQLEQTVVLDDSPGAIRGSTVIDNVRYLLDKKELKKHLLGISVWKRHYCFMEGISPQRAGFYPPPSYVVKGK